VGARTRKSTSRPTLDEGPRGRGVPELRCPLLGVGAHTTLLTGEGPCRSDPNGPWPWPPLRGAPLASPVRNSLATVPLESSPAVALEPPKIWRGWEEGGGVWVGPWVTRLCNSLLTVSWAGCCIVWELLYLPLLVGPAPLTDWLLLCACGASLGIEAPAPEAVLGRHPCGNVRPPERRSPGQAQGPRPYAFASVPPY